jgi:serine/threonine-protein kinase
VTIDHDRERWRKLDAILEEALDLEREEWPALLERACEGDADLRREAEELLAAHADTDSLVLDGSFADRAARLFSDRAVVAPPPERVGPWRVVAKVGEGGMGEVYLAERAEGDFEQRVALKRLRPDLASADLMRRFRQERQILATLEHPGIARLVDGGVDAGGQPWLALEYVVGEPITTWSAQRGLEVESKLRLVVEVCDAVAHAHRNLVVHRDLKPSNILVDRDGRVKLLDFGIAKLLTPEEGVGEAPTRLHALTPEYAAPEQFSGDLVTTATDVWALGVILHELLTGRRPEPAGGARGSAGPVRDPRRPSTVARALGGATGAGLSRRLRGDLDAIVLKTLRVEPERRYPSVEALADDLRRHLQRRPVRARGDAVLYRAGRFLRRHRLAVVAAALALLALVGGLVTTRREARRAEAAARVADGERAKAEAVRDFLVELFDASDPARALGADPSARDILARGRERIDRELADQPELRADLLAALANVYSSLGDPVVAEELRRDELGLRERLAGPTAELAVAARIAVADAVSDQGRSADAEAVFRQALALEEGSRGRDTLLAARALRGLGGALNAMSRFDEAVTVEERALALFERHAGPDDDETLQMRNNYAMLLLAQGEFDRAEALMRRVLEDRTRLEGADSAEVLWARFNLAATLLRAGRIVSAAELGHGLAEGFRRIWGADHFMSARALRLEARVLDLLGRHAEARPLREEALATARRALPPGELLLCLVEHSEHLRLSGDLDGAEAAAREARELGLAEEGPEADLTAYAASQLGGVLVDRGELAAAEPLLRHAEEVQRAAGGDDYPDRLETRSRLGRLLLRSGRRVEALAVLEDTLARRRATVGAASLKTAESLLDLAAALDPKAEKARRRGLLEEARAVYAASLPAGHPLLGAVERELAGSGS